MPSADRVTTIALAVCIVLSGAEPIIQAGHCDFDVEPLFPGYFWDTSCQEGMSGCNADQKNMECRFCGGGNYSAPCPPTSCHFPNEPFVPYYWDPDCKMGMLGCWADGIHAQCRFCGEHPFTGVPCPDKLLAPPNKGTCTFLDNEPTTPYYWDANCTMGMLGCNADGIHDQCRFCGKDVYVDIPCPASEVCGFANEPMTPYFWDPECAMGKLGCMADGLHAECRFCGKMPFEDIPCPGPIEPPKDQCTFPLGGEPLIGYYWDKTCKMGELGCWADGMHAECRFCGSGVFQEIPCPNATAAQAIMGRNATTKQRYDAATASRAFMRKVSLQAVHRNASANLDTKAGEDDEHFNIRGFAAAVVTTSAAASMPVSSAKTFLLGLIAAGLASTV